jgi:hypothetical protein
MIAPDLYAKRDQLPPRQEDYMPLLSLLLGEGRFDAAVAEDQTVIEKLKEALCVLEDAHHYGSIHRYIVEECFLYGRSQEDVAQEIAGLTEALVEQMISYSLRILRHPYRAKPIYEAAKPYIKEEA